MILLNLFIFFLFRLLWFVAVGILVLEAADLLGGGFFKRLFHGIHLSNLGVLADGFVYPVQNGLLAGLKLFKELVFTGLVPV